MRRKRTNVDLEDVKTSQTVTDGLRASANALGDLSNQSELPKPVKKLLKEIQGFTEASATRVEDQNKKTQGAVAFAAVQRIAAQKRRDGVLGPQKASGGPRTGGSTGFSPEKKKRPQSSQRRTMERATAEIGGFILELKGPSSTAPTASKPASEQAESHGAESKKKSGEHGRPSAARQARLGCSSNPHFLNKTPGTRKRLAICGRRNCKDPSRAP